MNSHTSYFGEMDLSQTLEQLVQQLHQEGKKTIEELFTELRNADLNTVQELLLLEIVFRIMNADERHDENEIKFVRDLRSKLKVHDEIILERFGKVDFLFDRDYRNEITIADRKTDLLHSIVLPEIEQLQSVDLSSHNN